jgi:hypothetical protein
MDNPEMQSKIAYKNNSIPPCKTKTLTNVSVLSNDTDT